jgi:small subunit ribosomal protein S16
VAVKIKLKRIGKIHAPQYRIVVADSRTARNGRAIEEIGIYQPMQNPSVIKVNSDRVQYWLGVGAQPTEAVAAILKVTGDWQKFKGLPGSEGTLEVAAPKPSKTLAFEAAVQAAAKEPKASPRPKLEKAVQAATEAVVVAEAAEAIAEEAAVEAVEAEVVAEKAVAEAIVAEEIAVVALDDPAVTDVVAEEAVAEAIVADAVADEAVAEAVVAKDIAEEAAVEAVVAEEIAVGAIEAVADEEAKA